MLPSITPRTKYRWQNRNTTNSGAITITAAVICKGQLLPPYEFLNTDSPTSNVRISVEIGRAHV